MKPDVWAGPLMAPGSAPLSAGCASPSAAWLITMTLATLLAAVCGAFDPGKGPRR